MKPETACEKIMNETFVQIIHLLNNLERTVVSDQGILMKELKRLRNEFFLRNLKEPRKIFRKKLEILAEQRRRHT